MSALEAPERVKPSVVLDLTKKVIGQVMTALGLPPGWVLTKATNVFDNKWRVDVWAKQPNLGAPCLVNRYTIVDSFFVAVDNEGKVTSPSIELKYKGE